MIRLRHADEWVGLLVVVAVAAFLGAVLCALCYRRPVSPAFRSALMWRSSERMPG